MSETRKLTDRERDQLHDSLQRLQNQSKVAQFMIPYLVTDKNAKPMKKVTPDFAVGDFLVYDMKRHPEL